MVTDVLMIKLKPPSFECEICDKKIDPQEIHYNVTQDNAFASNHVYYFCAACGNRLLYPFKLKDIRLTDIQTNLRRGKAKPRIR